ncbi:MAG: DegT/DnrJ/EryC1/StrS family aminotransferase [Anaerorhabdus sp.]
MKILNNRLDRQFELLKSEYMKKIEEVLDNGWYVLGPEVKNFELEFSKYNDAKYCIGVASGLDALILAFESLNLEPGDEVICPANTYIATVMGFTKLGLIPQFVEPNCFYNIDVDKIEEKITNKTKAICVVHLYGQIANMIEIMKIAKKYNLYVVEDCAQSHGAEINGKKCGTFGDLGCFSFYPTKNLGAFGDAGAVITNNHKYYERIKMLRNYGSKQTYYFEEVGYNSRLDEIQAGLLRVKLNHLNAQTQERRRIANIFLSKITNPKIKLPQKEFGEFGHVFHLFVIQIEDRNSFINYCSKNDIEVKIHYPQPPHLSKAYSYLGYSVDDFPISESMAEHVVSLPIYVGLLDDEIEYIINVVNRY